jgi:hypothetical protein
LLALVVSLGGCGKSSIVAVRAPLLPIYICPGIHGRCEGERFDVGPVIGMVFTKADAFVKAHGYELRKIAPLGPGGALTADYNSGRIDVETSGIPTSSIVTRIVKRG